MLLDSLRIMEHTPKHDEDPEFQSLLNELGFGTEHHNAGSHHNDVSFSSEQGIVHPPSAYSDSAVRTVAKKAEWPLEWLPEQYEEARTANDPGYARADLVTLDDQNSFQTVLPQNSPAESRPEVSESSQVQKLKKGIKSRDKLIIELKKLLLEEKELRLARQKQIENHRELLEFKKIYQDLLPVHHNMDAELQRVKTEVEASRALNEQQAALIEMLKKDIVDLKIKADTATAPERAKLSVEMKELKKQLKQQEEQIDDKNRTIAKLRKSKGESLGQISSSDGGDLMKNLMEKMRQMVADEIKKHGNVQGPSSLSAGASPSHRHEFGQGGSDMEDVESFRLPSRMSSYGDNLAFDGTYSGSTGISLATLSPPSSVENDFVDTHGDQALDEVRTRFRDRQIISDMEVPSERVDSEDQSKTFRDIESKDKRSTFTPNSNTRFKRSSALVKRNRSSSTANAQSAVDTSVGEKFNSLCSSLSPVLPDSEVSITLSTDTKSKNVQNSIEQHKLDNLKLPEVTIGALQKSVFDIDGELLSPIRTCVDDAVREFFMSPQRISGSKSQLSLCSTSSEELVFTQHTSAQPSCVPLLSLNLVAKEASAPIIHSLPELTSDDSATTSVDETFSRSRRKRKRSVILSDEEFVIPEMKTGRLTKSKTSSTSEKVPSSSTAGIEVLSLEENLTREPIETSSSAGSNIARQEKSWVTKRKHTKSTGLDSVSDRNDAVLDKYENSKKNVAPTCRIRNSAVREKIGDPTLLVAVGSGERMCAKKRMELLAKERIGKTSMQLLGKCSAGKIPKFNEPKTQVANSPVPVEDDVHMPEAPAQVVVLPSVCQGSGNLCRTVADDLQLSSDDESVSSGSSPRKSSSSTSISSVESLSGKPAVFINTLPAESNSTPVHDVTMLLKTRNSSERATPDLSDHAMEVSRLTLRSRIVTKSNDFDIPTRVKTVPSRIYCTRRSKIVPDESNPLSEFSGVITEPREQSIDHRIHFTRRSRSKIGPQEPISADQSLDVMSAHKQQTIEHVGTVPEIVNQRMYLPAKEVPGSTLLSSQHISARERIRNSLPIIAVGSGENVCDKKKLEMMAAKTLSLRKKPTDDSGDVQNSAADNLSRATIISEISRVSGRKSTSAESNAVVVGIMRGSRAKAVTSQGLKAELKKMVRPARVCKLAPSCAPVETVHIPDIIAKVQKQKIERPFHAEQPFVVKVKNPSHETVPGEDTMDQKLLKMLFSKEAKTIDLGFFVKEFSELGSYKKSLPTADYLARRLYDDILHGILDYALQKIDEKVLANNSELLGKKMEWLMSAHSAYKALDVAVASFFICEVLNKEGTTFQRDDVLNGLAVSYGTVFKVLGLRKVAYDALFLILVRHTSQKYAFSQGFLSAFPDLYAEEIPNDFVLQRGIMLALLCAPLYADSVYHNNVRDILRDGLGQQVGDSDYKSVVVSVWRTSKDISWSHALMDLEKSLAMLLVQCRWATSVESMEQCFHEAYSGWCSKELTDAAFGSLLNSFVWATELHGSRDSGTERILKLFDTVIKGKHTGLTARLYKIVELGKNKLIKLNKNLLRESQLSNSSYCSHQSMIEQKKDEAKEEKKTRRRVKRKIRRAANKGRQAETS